MIKLLIDQKKVQKAKEKLGDDTFYIMMKELGIDDYDERNLKCKCPFHAEDTPSFIWNTKAGKAHCFGACHRSYDILDVFMHKGLTYIEAVQKLFDLTKISYHFGEHKLQTKSSYRYPKPVECTDKSKIYQYLSLRNISPETTDYLDIRQDRQGNIVFNYYDCNDTLTMVKYRPSRKIQKGENKNWCQIGADTLPILFNMNRINVSAPLLICSGELDCASALEAGFSNAVSIPLGDGNTQWINECWDWLEQFDEIIICPDNDDSGMKFCKDIVPRLGSWRCKVVNVPDFFETSDGKKLRIKDLNDCLYRFGKEKVLELIVNAKDSPVDSVTDFSEITNVDLNEIDGIQTGIRDLDKSLMKLFYGTFNIVTGVNGAGKSSLLSQLVCQCLDQQKNVWYYSGELPNFQSKNWINYILAGQRHLKQCRFEESTYWKVTLEAQKKINEFYQGRLFIYKDGCDHKVSSLMKSMENTVRKYAAKLLIIDNLTSVNLENNDNNKYEKQAEFVTELINFAKKFNVVVVLVVHPHKMDTMRRMTKMDVQGISAIIDLAHRILSLYRVTPEDKKGKPKQNGSGWYKEPISCDVICDILKDRMMGFEGKGIPLFYDRPSRRFFTSEQDLDYQYGWDKLKHSGALPFSPPQLLAEQEVFGKV